MPRMWYVALATHATHEIITVLWGDASVGVVKRQGFKQFMAEKYLFSEIHAGFHTWSSMKYSLNGWPGELQHFIAVTCGRVNLTRHVECLTSACCVCDTSIWKIDRLLQARSIWALQTIQNQRGNPSPLFLCALATLLGELFNCSSSCVLTILFLCGKLDNIKIKAQDCQAWITSEMFTYTTNLKCNIYFTYCWHQPTEQCQTETPRWLI